MKGELPNLAGRRNPTGARFLAFAALLLVPSLLTACGEKQSSKAASGTNAASSQGSPLTAPVDYLGAVGKGQQTAEKVIETTSIERAIDMFKIDQGRNPKSLDELVKEGFLPKIPAPPYGMKIDYDPASGRVKLVKQQQ